jgi:hypothetical protein
MGRHLEDGHKSPPEGWAFGVTDLGGGMFRVRGVGPPGLSVERVGPHETTLLFEVMEHAQALASRMGRAE